MVQKPLAGLAGASLPLEDSAVRGAPSGTSVSSSSETLVGSPLEPGTARERGSFASSQGRWLRWHDTVGPADG